MEWKKEKLAIHKREREAGERPRKKQEYFRREYRLRIKAYLNITIVDNFVEAIIIKLEEIR